MFRAVLFSEVAMSSHGERVLGQAKDQHKVHLPTRVGLVAIHVGCPERSQPWYVAVLVVLAHPHHE